MSFKLRHIAVSKPIPSLLSSNHSYLVCLPRQRIFTSSVLFKNKYPSSKLPPRFPTYIEANRELLSIDGLKFKELSPKEQKTLILNKATSKLYKAKDFKAPVDNLLYLVNKCEGIKEVVDRERLHSIVQECEPDEAGRIEFTEDGWVKLLPSGIFPRPKVFLSSELQLWDPKSVYSKVFKRLGAPQIEKLRAQFLDPEANSKKSTLTDTPYKIIESAVPKLQLHEGQVSNRKAIANLAIASLKKFEKDLSPYLSGSLMNGLGLENSDINVRIRTHEALEWKVANTLIRKVAGNLPKKEFMKITTDTGKKKHAQIVNCYYKCTKLKLNITMPSHLPEYGEMSSSLIGAYANLHVVIQNLMFVVKHWANSRRLNIGKEGGLNNFGFMLTLISYLISIGAVPNLQKVCACHSRYQPQINFNNSVQAISSINQPEVCSLCEGSDSLKGQDGEPNVYFNANLSFPLRKDLPPQFNEYDLLLNYFEFMGTMFDPQLHAISIREGGLVLHDILPSLRKFPLTPLRVCDPFDPHDNVARATSAHSVSAILWEMRRAHHILKSKPSKMMDSLFLPYFPTPSALFIREGVFNRRFKAPAYVKQALPKS